MGWLTAKNSADDGVTAPSTISEKDWRGLQARAARANPKLADPTSKEAVDGRRAGAQQYRNRKQN